VTDPGLLPDGLIGGLGGALITGTAQVWSYRRGKKDTQATLSSNAAQQLLPVVYSAILVLRQLPYTPSAAGSPRSYEERLTASQPMYEALRAAEFTVLPAISSGRLRGEFRQLVIYCNVAGSPIVDAGAIFVAVNEAVTYAHYLGDCISAYISGNPFPAAPVPIYLSRHVTPLPPVATLRAWRGLLPPDPT